jgi:tRNA (guanine-N7-)-methyltransferase
VTVSLWQEVFGNANPVEIEIGPGRGDVLLAFSAADPATNFVGIEHRWGHAEAIAARARTRGLANVRVIAGDARCIVERLVPDASVAAYHVYFPDPWPKKRHHKRRVFTPTFTAALARTLVPRGSVHVASDLAEVVAAAAEALLQAGFERAASAPPRERPLTKFERKYALERTWAAGFTRT